MSRPAAPPALLPWPLPRLLALVIGMALAVALGLFPAPARAEATTAPDPAGLAGPTAPTGASGPVVELVRLRVPAAQRQAWERAERAVWEPWLRQKPGFISSEILWDGAREEAVVLIHWASLSDWKGIPKADIERQERRYERQPGVAPGGFPVLEVRALEPAAG